MKAFVGEEKIFLNSFSQSIPCKHLKRKFWDWSFRSNNHMKFFIALEVEAIEYIKDQSSACKVLWGVENK